jgi:DNA invertase Pin-like site-specific DNA recombinase
MLARGRKGVHGLRLTEAEEAAIVMLSTGKLKLSQRLLASTYGVNRGTILRVLKQDKAMREAAAIATK